MTAIGINMNTKQKKLNNLFIGYPGLYSDIYLNVKKTINEFFQKDINLRFMSVTGGENILFYGDEYFVNKIPVTKMSDIKIKISAGAIGALLDNALGVKETPFTLEGLTNIEAMLIKSLTVEIYENIQEFLDKTEINKKVIDSSKEYDLTFFISLNSQHSGKIIISIPDYMLVGFEKEQKKGIYNIEHLNKVKVNVSVSPGSSKIALNDIKTIEEGDIILLEESNINEMSVLWKGEKVRFRINPNPSLIISIDKNLGGNHMEDETSSKSQNMWDSILVDTVAEFDNVKLTLGELKQISEGLVIDVGSVYDNKIKLRVENQIVATGELVILNDRYGVRIDNVIRNKETKPAQAEKKPMNKQVNPQAPKKPVPGKAPQPKNANKDANGNENFDYSDFEIEDESI